MSRGLAHTSKTDIEIWQRVFDLLEGDNLREAQATELGSLMLEVQQRLAESRADNGKLRESIYNLERIIGNAATLAMQIAQKEKR